MDLAIIYILVTIKKKSNIIFPVPDFLQSKCAQFVVGRFQIFRYEITKLVIVQPKMKANSWLKCLAGYLHFFFLTLGKMFWSATLIFSILSFQIWLPWISDDPEHLEHPENPEFASQFSMTFPIVHRVKFYMVEFLFWVENSN